MTEKDLSALDRDTIVSRVFYPRPDRGTYHTGAVDVLVPVDAGVEIGGRFHMKSTSAPNVLFFHGNGEIVSDYDDMGPVYNRVGVNFMPVDYRGYGRSSGKPTISAMMKDCHTIYGFVRAWLDRNQYTGPLVVMGRSLGSASALELAAEYSDSIQGLIIESGFAYALPLFRLLGIDTDAMGLKEDSIGNIEKIRTIRNPTLIIHAEYDHIIPFSDAKALFEASPARDKTLLKIAGADHNDIFYRGAEKYMAEVKSFSERLSAR